MRIAAFYILAVWIAFVFPLQEVGANDAKPLTIVISNWPPYKHKELPEGGIVTDVTRQALVRAGYKVEVVDAPWKRALRGTVAGQFDVVPAIWLTKERGEKLSFSDAVITSRLVIVSRNDYDF